MTILDWTIIVVAFWGVVCFLWISEAYQYIFRWLKTEECRGGQPCLTFKQFKSFYDMAPDKWQFEHERVIYRVAWNDQIMFYFATYGDKLKYQKWRDAVIQYRRTKENLDRLNRAMAAIREDTQAYIEDAQAEADKNYQYIKENLSNEMDKSN